MDFTAEELQLEKEVEAVLQDLEVADAVVIAIKQQLENAQGDADDKRKELAQLHRAMESWSKAATESRLELSQREERLEELLGVFPEGVALPLTEPAALPDQGQEAQEAASAALAAQREERLRRQRELTAERLKVLTGQTHRLQDQVLAAELELGRAISERERMLQQCEAQAAERDDQRTLLKEARVKMRKMETARKEREEGLAVAATVRRDLERQVLRLRCEARGLQARLAAWPQPTNTCPQRIGPAAAASEEAHSVCLRLQWQIVDLWAALKQRDLDTENTLKAIKEATPTPLAAG